MAVWPAPVSILILVVFLVVVAVCCWIAKSDRVRCIKLRCTNRWCRGLTESRPRSLLAWDWLDAAHTYESSLAPGRIGAVLLLLWRFAALLLFAIGLLYQEYADSKGNPKDEGLTPTYFTFFTNWTYTGFGLYAFLAVLVSMRGIAQMGKHRNCDGALRFDLLHKAFTTVAVVIATSSLLLTVFYWAALHDYGEVVQFEDALKHGTTAAWLVIEMLISRVPVVSNMILVASIYALCYAVFLWIYWAAADKWVYDVLDWREGKSIGYYIAVCALVIAAFWIIFGVAALREAMVRVCPCVKSRREAKVQEQQMAVRSGTNGQDGVH